MINNRTILHGDALEQLKKIDDNSIDLITTDPPYGYSFLHKNWDKAIIPIPTWKECLRVLKPGAFAFVMSAPRQDVLSHMIVNLSDAGFNTNFTSIYWAYPSGFPKCINVAKFIDRKLGNKREIIGINEKAVSSLAKKLDGAYVGFQPKPALEVILVCMKPLTESTYTEQAIKNQKGITWLDDCRIPLTDNIQSFDRKSQKIEGRFPANLIISDNVLDTGKITKTQKFMGKSDVGGTGDSITFPHIKSEIRGYNDSGEFSRYFSLDSWEAQFIITPKPSTSEKNMGLSNYMKVNDKYNGKFPESKTLTQHKVNDGRKTKMDMPHQRGETIRCNTHPTVKPISLFKYLITMGSREGDIILDPFCGSGTTLIAAEKLNRKWIGVELNSEYIEIAKKRLSTQSMNNMDEYFEQ